MPYEEIIEKLESLTVVQLNELVKELEERWGVTAAVAAAPVAGAAAAGGGEAAEAAEEKSSYNVILKSIGGSKLDVIKVIRKVTGLGIKEAKELVDNAPKPVKEGVPKNEAEEIKKQLEEAGAQVELE